MKDRIGLGGFFLDNIKEWIIKECMESGDPDNFFTNVLDMVEELDIERPWQEPLEDELMGEPDYE